MTATAAVPPALEHFLELLAGFEARDARVEFLIDLADRYREVPAEVAQRPFPERTRVPQCESEVFVWAADRPDGTLDFHFAVDNPQGISARALAVVLSETLDGAPLEQVLAVPPDLPYEIFGRELSMGKSMGLTAMLAMVQGEARRRLRDGGAVTGDDGDG